jgi:GT2 family glycosyltransferase
VTYGTFGGDAEAGDTGGYPPPERVASDLARIAASGANALRVYTVPPRSLLDEAYRCGLRVLVGLPWSQHVAFADDPAHLGAIETAVREGVRACAGHPAVLCYAIGNEIPPSIVRWAGRRRIERHLRHLYEAAKAEDPEGLVTYCNFPSTEYLDLPFLDLACFNVYLEDAGKLAEYLARLQNLAGDKPLLLGEIGLDSRRNGEHRQARALYEQVRTAFAAGCAGAFVFAWTDEWHRGGQEVRDWDFGLVGRDRTPKPALAAVRRAFANTPFPADAPWPRASVVVCVYNGEETLDDCLAGLDALDYPDYEVLVVDDGSTDRSAEIAGRHRCRVLRTPNRGLSRARNRGITEASGEVVAFIDADARPDPQWLRYLVDALRDGEFVGVGGPNLPCRGDGVVADCVANAPGGPIHVLLSDREAEHIPGCNMAFRKAALDAIGGFDPTYRVAGDDVDICWRLQERGWKLGFSPAAVVWHHQRNTVGAYWRQQRGYGRAEALLELGWPEKYNASGQATWSGRIYAQPLLYALTATSRVYHGTWGTAAFQPRHAQTSLLPALAAAPEWYLVLLALTALSLLGLTWTPLLLALPLLLVGTGASSWRAVRGALLARFPEPARGWPEFRRRALVAVLFLLQPAARLRGRLANGLTPWRFRRVPRGAVARPHHVRLWSERWRDTAEWLEGLERRLRRARAVVRRGGPYDRWDLQVRDGGCGVVRLRMCVEDHGAGRQLLHFRVWPWPRSAAAWLLGIVPALLALLAALDGAWIAAAALGTLATLFSLRVARQSSAAIELVLENLRGGPRQDLVLLPGGRQPRRPSTAPPRRVDREAAVPPPPRHPPGAPAQQGGRAP